MLGAHEPTDGWYHRDRRMSEPRADEDGPDQAAAEVESAARGDSGSREREFDATLAGLPPATSASGPAAGHQTTRPSRGRQGAGDLGLGSMLADRYRVVREVGRGGMGSVYEVRDEQLDEVVALKLLGADASLAEALDRFKREVRLARRVTHRNVARTYDIGAAGPLHYLTMELVEGPSLADVLTRHGRLSLDRIVDIAVQVCDGLAAAHTVGVIHRDLKPANILLEVSGRAVITDFGIARSTVGDAELTSTRGQLMGTPAYMAPEQVRGADISPRTDIYALGLILYEMVTGRRAFERTTPLATAIARLEEELPSTRIVAEVPVPLAEVISDCVRRDPDQRPADVLEVARRLRASVPGTGSATDSVKLQVAAASPDCGTTRMFAPTDPGSQGVAVLPLRYRGPSDDAYMAEVVTDEIIDLLSATRGLRVPAASATAPFAEERDPHRVGRELDVQALVDATLQRLGARVRLSARLIDARTGVQAWSDRFEGDLTDLFELQDSLARRVSESLRVQLQSGVLGRTLPTEAAELYLQARHQMKRYDTGGERAGGAVDLFERCLELAPDFPSALAGLAMACGRLWFFHTGAKPGLRNWPQLCRRAVERALSKAPELPETHIAASRMHLQEVRYGEAARALHNALELAPTCASAHAALGNLQCEAGRPSEGIRHIEVATDLDPSERWTLVTAARHLALHGRWDEAYRMLEQLDRDAPGLSAPIAIVRMRMLLWSARNEELAALLEGRTDDPTRVYHFPFILGQAALGRRGPEEIRELFAESFAPGASPRLEALAHQIACEAFAHAGHLDVAMHHLEEAARLALVDVDWLRHCPPVAALREQPGFGRVYETVRLRAEAIWTL